MKLTAKQKMMRAAAAAGKPYKFSYSTLNTGAYAWNVGDIWAAYDYGDYNSSTGKIRAVRVSYPYEYYAAPRYISTAELNSIYRAGDTLDGFISRVFDRVDI